MLQRPVGGLASTGKYVFGRGSGGRGNPLKLLEINVSYQNVCGDVTKFVNTYLHFFRIGQSCIDLS